MSAANDAGGHWPTDDEALAVRVVKRAPSGAFVTDYPGSVVPFGAPGRWLAVEAVWDNPPVLLDGLAFRPGDRLLEYFSPDEWFNAFAVHAPDGRLRGWYANVTFPARFDPATDPPTLTWRDLFVDVVFVPGAEPAVRDEDELAAAGVAAADPALHARIVAARDAILDRCRRGAFPFAPAGSADESGSGGPT